MEVKSHLCQIMQFCFLCSFLLSLYLSVLLRPNFLQKLKYTWFSYTLSQICKYFHPYASSISRYATEVLFFLASKLSSSGSSSPMKSRKWSARDVMYTYVTHTKHAHDVTYSVKMAAPTAAVFAT